MIKASCAHIRNILFYCQVTNNAFKHRITQMQKAERKGFFFFNRISKDGRNPQGSPSPTYQLDLMHWWWQLDTSGFRILQNFSLEGRSAQFVVKLCWVSLCSPPGTQSTQTQLHCPVTNHQGWFSRHTETVASPTFLLSQVRNTILWSAALSAMFYPLPEMALNITSGGEITSFREQQKSNCSWKMLPSSIAKTMARRTGSIISYRKLVSL